MTVSELASKVKTNVARVIVGKDPAIELLMIALLAGGHVLVEDVPGSGKTMLAKSFARSLGCSFRRIQFTPDLLPSDITGIKYFNMKESEFEFIPGPAFANILLADEINRATPKTQSGLLECMEERQVTVEGETYALPAPFMVIATQNPVENMGVFPLPEAQLDRFLLKAVMGYPTREESVSVLARFDSPERDPLETLQPVVSARDVGSAQAEAAAVYVHPDLYGYITDLIEATRDVTGVVLGASMRSGLALLKTAKGRAALDGRTYVLPDDIKKMAVPVLAHRLILKTSLGGKKNAAEEIVTSVLNSVAVPTEELDRYKL